jgi:hypothetical protein
MGWIKGRDLLEPPYNRTMREVFKAVQEGILVPWESPDAEYIKKHEKHAILGADFERIWRAFPTPELQKRWVSEVHIKESVLKNAREWLLKSDEEHIEAHKHALELYQSWGEYSPRSLVSLEEYKNRMLPEERQQKLKIINDYPSHIEKLEKEFSPGRVWKNLDLGPVRQEILIEKLLEAFYELAEVESFLPQKELPKKIKEKIRHDYQVEIEQLIKEAMPEIEIIYTAVKEKVGFSGRDNVGEKDWQAAALKIFDKDVSQFTFIKREYLEEKKIYFFTGGQERRDFVGGILQMIVKKELAISMGAQELYKRTRKFAD